MTKILAGLLFSSALFAATDVSGKWAGFPVYVTFHQDGNKLSGTAGQSPTDQIPFENGAIENDHITFKLANMEADLRVIGEEISGEVHDGGNVLKIVLRRVKVRDASAPPPAFDAASVKQASPGAGGNSRSSADAGRVTFVNQPLKKLIGRAWGLKDYQIGGPDWLNDARFDVTATMPAGTPVDEVLTMLQTLLTDRFKLSIHRETKDMPIYAMTVENGLFKLPPGATAGHTNISPADKGLSLTADTTMASLASTLSDFLDRPVIDATDIKGAFHISFQWIPAANANPDAIGPSIFTALHENGLKLQPRRAPVEILTVDHAERVPVEN